MSSKPVVNTRGKSRVTVGTASFDVDSRYGDPYSRIAEGVFSLTGRVTVYFGYVTPSGHVKRVPVSNVTGFEVQTGAALTLLDTYVPEGTGAFVEAGGTRLPFSVEPLGGDVDGLSEGSDADPGVDGADGGPLRKKF